MNENYKIYVHIFPNGKLYIGQTRQSLKNRFGKNGYKYKGCKRMSDAICEFGWDNIIHLLLFDNLTSEIADIIEIELIKKENVRILPEKEVKDISNNNENLLFYSGEIAF